MALGRKKRGGRKEPQFGLAAAVSDLRLTPQDRVPPAEEDKPKKAAPRRKAEDSPDEPPPGGKQGASPPPAKRRSRSAPRLRLGRLVYWGAVLGLWAAIAAVGLVIW